MTCYTIIAAIARNGVIGKNNTLPWHLPADMAFFKKTTTGHTIVMGRKNYEDIGRPLPNRRNIVLSRDPEFKANGCEVFNTYDEMITETSNDDEVFIIGGAGLYVTALRFAQKMLLTKIDSDIDGDIYFPEINWQDWKEISNDHHNIDEKNKYEFNIVAYERKSEGTKCN